MSIEDEQAQNSLRFQMDRLQQKAGAAWLLVDVLQSALLRAENFLGAKQREDVFTPDTKAAMTARQDQHSPVASARVAKKFFDAGGDLLGVEFRRSDLAGPTYYGVTGESDPAIRKVEVC